MCQHVSPTHTDGITSRTRKLYTTQERSDLGTESFTLIRFLILNEEKC